MLILSIVDEMCVLLRTDEVVDDSYGKQVILPLFLPPSSKAERHLHRRDHDALSVLTERFQKQHFWNTDYHVSQCQETAMERDKVGHFCSTKAQNMCSNTNDC